MRRDRFKDRQSREKFVQDFQTEIGGLLDGSLDGHYEISKDVRFFLITVRCRLGYSPKTVDIDVWRSIRKTYHRLGEEGKLLVSVINKVEGQNQNVNN